MAGKKRPYVIRAGDYLTAIAYACGVTPETIWNDPANDALRKKRQNYDVLAPGDVLQVPIIQRKWLPIKVGSVNTFVATPPRVPIQLALYQDDGGKNALSGMKYSIEGASGDGTEGTLDESGIVKFEVTVITRQVSITIDDLGLTYPIVIGGIDPVDVPSGTAQRLAQLGYLDGHAATPAMGDALAMFQRDAQIDDTGTCDDATAKALVAKHGS